MKGRSRRRDKGSQNWSDVLKVEERALRQGAQLAAGGWKKTREKILLETSSRSTKLSTL